MDPNCEHINIIQTTCGDTCTDCGLILVEDSTEYDNQNIVDDQYVSNKAIVKEPFSYHTELVKLNLNPKICINVTQKIKELEHKTHMRKSKYIKNLFVMIYSAYIEENIPFNITTLKESLKMSNKQIREAIKSIPKSVNIDTHHPYSFFEEITEKFRDQYVFPKNKLDDVKNFIDFLLENGTEICNESPDGIAAAVYKIFLDRNNIKLKNFNKKAGRTQLYIRTRENMIYDICNKITEK